GPLVPDEELVNTFSTSITLEVHLVLCLLVHFDVTWELKAHRAIVVKYYERSSSVSSKWMTNTPYYFYW
ncbi:36182_t:CDS:1, partial [Gigaspora margarita]